MEEIIKVIKHLEEQEIKYQDNFDYYTKKINDLESKGLKGIESVKQVRCLYEGKLQSYSEILILLNRVFADYIDMLEVYENEKN